MSMSSCAGGVSFFLLQGCGGGVQSPLCRSIFFFSLQSLSNNFQNSICRLFSSFPLHIYGDDIQSSTRRDPSVQILFIHDFDVPIPDPLKSLHPFRQFMRWKDMWDVTQISKNTFRESGPLNVFHKLSNIVVAVAVLL